MWTANENLQRMSECVDSPVIRTRGWIKESWSRNLRTFRSAGSARRGRYVHYDYYIIRPQLFVHRVTKILLRAQLLVSRPQTPGRTTEW